MNVKVIFTVLILVSVLVISNLSENLAFAAKEDKPPKVDVNYFENMIDDLVSIIDEIREILDTLRIAFDTEVLDRTEADMDLQAQIDELRTLYEGETEAATISPYYIVIDTFTTPAGTSAKLIISCEDEDRATSANLVKLDSPQRFLQVFSSFQSGDGNSWTFLVVNTHPTISLGSELTVDCLRAEV